MNVVDLHPEDLLDKDANGELTETESERLEAHLARCATCRFERDARADFAAELGIEEELSSQRLVALIERTAPFVEPSEKEESSSSFERDKQNKRGEQGEQGREQGERGEQGERRARKTADDSERSVDDMDDDEELARLRARLSSRPSQRRNVRIALLVAAALLVGSAATAGGAHVWAQIAAVWSDPGADVTLSPHAPPLSMGASAVVPQRVPPELREREERDDLVTPETPTSAIVPVSTAMAPVGSGESAATLFDAANEARRQGDYARAITLHRRLQQTHPSSREAHVSHGTVGRLLLDRGDAASALASFDAYQARGSGALDEPVMIGRATALERLGRTDEARNAWGALLIAFPETPYAEHARLRVQRSRSTGPATTPDLSNAGARTPRNPSVP